MDADARDILVTVLGSGTCVPSLARSSASLLVRHGEAELVFDMGAGTLRRMLEAGATHHSVTHILFTHQHTDHTGGFPAFLFACAAPTFHIRLKPLHVLAGRGFAEFHARLKDVWGKWMEMDPALFTLTELSTDGPDEAAFPGFRLISMPVAHCPESIAFRVDFDNGKSLVYSGDTDVCDGLVELARGADLFVCESATPDGHKAPAHLTPSLAGEAASRAGVKKLMLTHFYPECEGHDLAGQCRKTWQGPLVLAEDLMEARL
jgi:ribonuclease BN (tRNA processing enzyme)